MGGSRLDQRLGVYRSGRGAGLGAVCERRHLDRFADVAALRIYAGPRLSSAARLSGTEGRRRILPGLHGHASEVWLVGDRPVGVAGNWFLTPDGKACSVSMGPTCDRVLIYALFTACIEASAILSSDPEFRDQACGGASQAAAAADRQAWPASGMAGGL